MRIQKTRLRNGQLPPLVLVGVVLAVVVSVIGFIWNSYYGQPVMVLEQRFVVADIGDFNSFIDECKGKKPTEASIVTLRDGMDGNFMLLRLRILESFMYDKRQDQNAYGVFRKDDFRLVSDTETWTPILLNAGEWTSLAGGAEKIRFGTKVLEKKSDGQFEISEIESSEEAASLDALTSLASGGSGGSSIRDDPKRWFRPPLKERVSIVRPPTLNEHVFHAAIRIEDYDAWLSAEPICLFPLPPPGTKVKLVVGRDSENAVAIDVL